jgi:acylglycerol lipase
MKQFEFKWKSSDGLDIFARGWEPGDRAPDGVICLVHGIGEHTLRYLNVAKSLTAKGRVLFGADLRGHGHSAGPRGHFPSIESVLLDIDLLLDKARERYPGLPLFLYGHSLGGILVLHYALKRNPDIKGVIATSPGLRTALEQQPVKVMAAKLLGSLIPSVSVPSGLDINEISRDQEVVEEYTNDTLVHNRMSLGFGKVMIDVVKSTIEHAGGFKYPLLLMHGKKDSIAYPSGSIDFASNVNNSCKLVLWEEALHELHNEPEKDEVLSTLNEWIDSELK